MVKKRSASKKRVTKKKVQRRAARSKTGGRSAARSSESRFHRGAAGRGRVDSELADQKEKQARRQAASKEPFRVYLKPGTEGREIVILDEEPEFFFHEHQIYNGGRRDLPMYTYVPCVKEWATCQACEEIKDSYYALYLSVCDLEPFKTGKGEEVEFSRKLMLIKPQQQKKFIRRWKKEGTLRGQIVILSRDTDKDPVIGNDIEFDDFMEEDALAEYVREWTDAKKKVHTEDCSVPYEYEKIFEEPSEERIDAIVKGKATPGSKKQTEEELADDWDPEEEDTPWDEEEDEEEETPRSRRKKKAKSKAKKKRPSRAATRRRQREEEEEEDEEEDEDETESEDEDELEEEEEDEAEEEEDEEVEEDEEEEEEEERPRQRKKRSSKKKRRATSARRGR